MEDEKIIRLYNARSEEPYPKRPKNTATTATALL